MKKIKRFAPVVLAAICVFVLIAPAFAQVAGGFSIRAVLPDNQVDKKQTYFDLRMDAGARQTVELVITNSRDEPMEAKIELNTAATGRNGLIFYNLADTSGADSDIRNYATLRQETANVPAGGTFTVQIDLAMPNRPMSGVVLGGITVSEVASDDEGKGGVSVKNAVAYVVALKLAQSDELPSADFQLVSVSPALTNYRPTVVAKLRNPIPRIVKGMEVSAQVYRKGADTPLHTLELNSADMAPASIGDFVIDWDNQPLRQGSYRLRMTATYDGRTWEWDEDFVIGGEAGDINGGAVGLKHDYVWLYIIAVLLVLILVALLAYRRGKKERKDSDA